MSVFVEVDHVNRVFPLADGGHYIALQNIALKIKQGEFVSLIGHSGCGKSTLLNIIAGLDQPTEGGIILEGRQVTKPGPDRMVVFQNYSLLPWLSVRENIALAVDEVYPRKPKGERKGIVEHHIDLVKLRNAADKRPGELSGGMKQRVAIARALAIRPKLLLLDEPFGALDALTRGSLQDQLMHICEENKVTCVMVTHDVDEALLLSDRIVMLTNGPSAHIGQIIQVEIPRPRDRMEVVNHPNYYSYRNEIVYFLNQQKKAKKRQVSSPAVVSSKSVEKTTLNIGFIPLTDCAPLVVAKEKGFFEKHGLKDVTLQREGSWKAITNGITSGTLDAAQMAAGMPLAMTMGLGGNSPFPVVTGLTLSRNGNAITLSKQLYEQGVRSVTDLKAALTQGSIRPPVLGVVHPGSMHDLMLRYWLASGGIDPDTDIRLSIVPPPEMVEGLRNGSLDGYCVGEPWNSQAVVEKLGFVTATDLDIWPNHVEKVLGVREEWAKQYPQTHLALIKALLEACEYCDNREHRGEILELLCKPQYVGAAPEYIRPGFIDPYSRGTDQPSEILLQYSKFSVNKTNCPDRVEALWIVTQMARWGLVPFPRNWIELIDRVRQVNVYSEAAQQLGLPGFEPDRAPIYLFDGTVFNPDNPMQYLQDVAIKRDVHIQEIVLDPVAA